MYEYDVSIIVFDVLPGAIGHNNFINLHDAKQYMQAANNIQSKEMMVCNEYSGSPDIASNFIKIKCIKANGKLLDV